MNSVFTLNISKEAFDHLCELRDLIFDTTGDWIPLNKLCSTLICQVFIGGLDEKAS